MVLILDPNTLRFSAPFHFCSLTTDLMRNLEIFLFRMSKATRTRKAKKRRKTRIIGGACKARRVSNAR